MSDFTFTEKGWEHYLYWQTQDRKTLKKKLSQMAASFVFMKKSQSPLYGTVYFRTVLFMWFHFPRRSRFLCVSLGCGRRSPRQKECIRHNLQCLLALRF